MTLQHECEYRTQASRLRLILEQARDFVLVVGMDGQILDANRAAIEGYGYNREELLGLNIRRLRAAATLDEVAPQMKAAHDSGVSFETEHVCKDGTVFSVEVSSQRAFIEGEEVLISIVRDISHRKKIENELRLTQFSVENAAEATIWIESDGRIFYANRTACGLLGYTKAELVGTSVLDIDASISRHDWQQHWQEVKSRGAMTFESAHRTRSGSVVPVEITASHLEFEGHELHCSFFHSIEERKLLEEQLRQSQKMEAIGRLAGGIAHDFNNLLMVISGYAEGLATAATYDTSAISKINAIREAASRGATLTRQLLAFSRKQQLQPSVLNINDSVRQVADMAARILGEDIDVKVVMHPRLGLVAVDSGQLQQVLLNLIVNARDAMPSGGTLTIETASVNAADVHALNHSGARSGAYVLVSVTDTGCGMDEQTRKNCFEPFFTTKPVGKGTGLGLSTVYGIVQQSGGEISVRSEVGRGTTFEIHFPVVTSTSAAVPVLTEVRTGDVRGKGELILLVEDESALRTLLCENLRASGYRVVSASNLEEAIDAVRQNGADIAALVTDFILRGSTGRQVAEAIRRDVPGVKIVYMSGHTFDQIKEDELLRDAAFFIQKPFTHDELLEVLSKLLRGAGPCAEATSCSG